MSDSCIAGGDEVSPGYSGGGRFARRDVDTDNRIVNADTVRRRSARHWRWRKPAA